MKKKTAFTLVELLIAISLGTILLAVSFWALSNTVRLYGKTSKDTARLQICSMVLDRIGEDAVSAKKVSSSSTQSLLILEYPDFILRYDYNNGKVRRRKGSSSAYLTDAGDVGSLSFDYSGKLITIKCDKLESKAYCRN